MLAFHSWNCQVRAQVKRTCVTCCMKVSRRKWISNYVLSLSILNFLQRPLWAQVTYDKYAKKYDLLETSSWNQLFQLDALRRQLLSFVSGGRVLEVAIGTGLNLVYYPWQSIEQFRGIDTSSNMLQQTRNKLESLSKYYNMNWELINASVTRLPFPDDYFDHVVDTFSLCVFDNPDLALKEMRRVCKKGGTILLLEHSSSPYCLVREYQRYTGKLVAKLAKGCDWSLPLQELLKKVDFSSVIYEKYALLGTVSLHVVSK